MPRQWDDLLLKTVHNFGNAGALLFIEAVVLDLNPSIDRVSSLSVLSQVHSFKFGLRVDPKKVEIVERVEDQETPDGRPESNTHSSSNIYTQQIPRLNCVALETNGISKWLKNFAHLANNHTSFLTQFQKLVTTSWGTFVSFSLFQRCNRIVSMFFSYTTTETFSTH